MRSQMNTDYNRLHRKNLYNPGKSVKICGKKTNQQ